MLRAQSLASSRILTIAAALCVAPHVATFAQSFTWDNAIIYFVMTDRFANGDDTNDHSYGRGLDRHGNPIHANSPGRFFGGDLKGLTAKVEDGYFDELGVNVIWITSPLEQVHGWVGGGDGSYPTYPYHGYWPLDFTRIDGNVGTPGDLESFVRTCHDRGIRVLMDVVINHAGYNTLRDMEDLRFGAFRDTTWHDWSPGRGESWHSYHDRFINYGDSAAWSTWWGADWLRAGVAGYPACGETHETTCTSSLPDFRTESLAEVNVPAFLRRKWKRAEKQNTADSTAVEENATSTVREFITGWLADWVRKTGIDGFRLDTARNLDLETIRYLKHRAATALRAWKEASSMALDESEFWMVGEVFGHGVERTDYFDYGLDAVLNFDFQRDVERGASLDSLFSTYATMIGSDPSFNVVSYLSSHDTYLFDRDRLFDAATALMLVPGNVQIFYGDETGRAPSPDEVDEAERVRSPMNWDDMDVALLNHWQRLGQFRSRHPSLALGRHDVLSMDPYAFRRSSGIGAASDEVIVVLAEPGRVRLNVSKVYGDNVILRDAYTDRTSFVSYGMVHIEVGDAGVALLEKVK